MRKLAVLVIAAAFLGTTGTAFAQRIDLVTSPAWQGDEPNVEEAGTIPYGRGDPSADYPADDNGMETSLAGEAAIIVAGKAVSRYTVPVVTSASVDNTHTLKSFTGSSFLVPGPTQYQAYHGTWVDLNENGYIDDMDTASAAHVNTRGGCPSSSLGTDVLGMTRVYAGDDPSGGLVVSDVPTGVSARCAYSDEWTPKTNTLVGYLTPGEYGDYVNGALGARGGRAPSPDFTMTQVGSSGQYYAPTSNFEVWFADNSLLETTVLEIISAPATIAGGPRTFEQDAANPESRTDVDLYQSVSSDAEQLYQENVVATFTASKCQVEYPQDCPNSAVQALYYALAAETYAAVGPTYSQVFVPMPPEDHGFDYTTGPHLYLNIAFSNSLSVSGVGTHFQYGPASNTAPLADGSPRPIGQMLVTGIFGVWQDLNGDGYIGDAQDPVDGCDDAHQCGAVQDPNCPTYVLVPNAVDVICGYTPAESAGEFQGVCGPKNPASAVASSVNATMTSSTGSWGAVGVYVITDRRSATSSTADEYRTGGRTPFNPYDDAVLDASDGSVDLLYTTGEIPFHLQCVGGGGYTSYERFIFPEGNRGFDVTIEASITSAFVSLGIPLPETVTDSDTYVGYDVP